MKQITQIFSESESPTLMFGNTQDVIINILNHLDVV